MSNLDPLILDFLEWLMREPRPYADVMEAWRTSCPRLTVWEDALDRGLVRRSSAALIEVTPQGEAFLSDGGRSRSVFAARGAPTRASI